MKAFNVPNHPSFFFGFLPTVTIPFCDLLFVFVLFFCFYVFCFCFCKRGFTLSLNSSFILWYRFFFFPCFPFSLFRFSSFFFVFVFWLQTFYFYFLGLLNTLVRLGVLQDIFLSFLGWNDIFQQLLGAWGSH